MLRFFEFQIQTDNLRYTRSGVLVRYEKDGQVGWGEASPLSPFSCENKGLVIQQLKAVGRGLTKDLYPSVAFALYCAKKTAELQPEQIAWPMSYLLMGTLDQIIQQADHLTSHISTITKISAKIKLNLLNLNESIEAVQTLKDRFFLRVDVNREWSLEQLEDFCSHFNQNDIDYIEDPAQDTKYLETFPFPFALDWQKPHERLSSNPYFKAIIWKPTIKGIPLNKEKIILSSSFESSVGLAGLVFLANDLKLEKHPIGIGTHAFLKQELLNNPIEFYEGMVKAQIPLHPKLGYLKEVT